MSLVTKIPPLVSALAFGYGVGMAAPESTISSMHSAVHGTMDAYNRPAYEVRPSLPPLPPETARAVARSGWPVSGDESRELSRLRDVGARDGRGGETCELDRPRYSRPPRYESRRDREVDDVDDLDNAGNEALSRLQLPDMKATITKRTLKYVKFFTRTDRGRGLFETWLKRSGRYQELIQTEL